MKHKIIKSIFAITAAVCITYGSIRSAYQYIVPDTTATATTVTTTTLITEDISSESENSSTDTTSETAVTDSSTNTTSETTIADSSSSDETVTDSSHDDTTTEDIPTLSEYLSTLRCGGCGRNCFLLDPRCHRGESKAESATTAYYAEYSQN